MSTGRDSQTARTVLQRAIHIARRVADDDHVARIDRDSERLAHACERDRHEPGSGRRVVAKAARHEALQLQTDVAKLDRDRALVVAGDEPDRDLAITGQRFEQREHTR
jgi:hypothetical protein